MPPELRVVPQGLHQLQQVELQTCRRTSVRPWKSFDSSSSASSISTAVIFPHSLMGSNLRFMPGAPAMSPRTPELSICAPHAWSSMPAGASGAPPPAELLKIHAFGCLRRCDLWLGHFGEALDELKVLHVLRLPDDSPKTFTRSASSQTFWGIVRESQDVDDFQFIQRLAKVEKPKPKAPKAGQARIGPHDLKTPPAQTPIPDRPSL